MKTLDQIEPRTPIASLPFTITNAGSYYVTTNLVAATGQNGIVVEADDVSIDLCGFTLTGSGADSGSGILDLGQHRNLNVRNGKLVNWKLAFEAGLRALGPNGRFSDLQLAANYWGAQLLSDSLIQHCSVFSNLNDGIYTANRCVVEDCHVAFNGDDGIQVSGRSLVRRNTCQKNGGAGIHLAGSYTRAEDNHAVDNVWGVRADGALNLVIRNVASGNTTSNYNLSAGNAIGEILNVTGQTISNSNPWANIEY